jgi:hypothetical protein
MVGYEGGAVIADANAMTAPNHHRHTEQSTMAEPSIHQEPFFAEGTEAMVALEAMVDHRG